MNKKIQNRQAELTDFNQPCGFKINPLIRWAIKASTIPWDAIEESVKIFLPNDVKKCLTFAGIQPFEAELRHGAD